MKKILSTLTIFSILSSTSFSTISCNSSLQDNSKSKFNLNSLEISDIDANALSKWAYPDYYFQLHCLSVYHNVENQIINQYDTFFNNSKIITQDQFTTTKLDSSHTWKVQIYIGDPNNKNALPFDINNSSQPFYADDFYNNDNSFSIVITTSNPNVTQKKAIVKGYLNRFMFSSKMMNKGLNMTLDGSKSILNNSLLTSKMVDLSAKKKLPLNASLTYLMNFITGTKFSERNQWANQKIFDAFNSLYNFRMRTQIKNGWVPQLKPDFKNPKNYLIANPLIFTFGELTNNHVESYYGGPLTPNAKIVAKIMIGNWSVLTQYTYSITDTYIFAYLGTVKGGQ